MGGAAELDGSTGSASGRKKFSVGGKPEVADAESDALRSAECASE